MSSQPNANVRSGAGRATCWILTAALAIGAIVWPAGAGPLTISNGVDGPGALTVTVDDFGAYGEIGLPSDFGPDIFDPGGELDPEPVTYYSYIQVSIDPSEMGDGTHRGVMSSIAGEGTLTGEITLPNELIDPATCLSAFDIVGDGVHISVTLTQQVSELSVGPNGEPRAQLEQAYAFTNLGKETVELVITRHVDHDLRWGEGGPFHSDDLIGVDYAELDRFQIYAQEHDLTTVGIVLRTESDLSEDPLTTSHSQTGANNFVYYIGKQNMPAPPGNPGFPGGDCPPHDYGTDSEIWDNYGVPNCWKNFCPGIGYNVPGISPAVAGDAFMGLQTEGGIGPGEAYAITYQKLYGYRPQLDVLLPPALVTQTVEYGEDGCAEFLWRFKNTNPDVPGQEPVEIDVFFIDVEAGSGSDQCATMTPPEGWQVQLCEGYENGHALYRFFGGPPIEADEIVRGRLRIDTNGLEPFLNAQTGMEVPPLSVVLHPAQDQEEAECNFNFGPSGNGEWGLRTTATAYLPVPSANVMSKGATLFVVLIVGVLVLRRNGIDARREVQPTGSEADDRPRRRVSVHPQP